MKINDYESVTSLNDDDNFIVETSAGTKKVTKGLLQDSVISVLGGVRVRHIVVQKTVQPNSTTEFNFDSYLESNERIVGVTCTGGSFCIPYIESSSATTFISRMYEKYIVLRNGNSNWDNYLWNFVLFTIIVPEETQALE